MRGFGFRSRSAHALPAPAQEEEDPRGRYDGDDPEARHPLDILRYSPYCLEKLSEKPRRRLLRSPTDRREGSFRPLRPPHSGRIHARSVARITFRTVSGRRILRSRRRTVARSTRAKSARPGRRRWRLASTPAPRRCLRGQRSSPSDRPIRAQPAPRARGHRPLAPSRWPRRA
jgi:hypothetical protein